MCCFRARPASGASASPGSGHLSPGGRAAPGASTPDRAARAAYLTRRGQLLRASGEQVWPDGTVAGCYSFIHALYQEVVYQRVPAAQRVYLHRRIGARAEAGYGTQAGDIAAELAMHFERGETTTVRWRICGTRLILPCAGMPMPKRPITSQRDLPCSRPSGYGRAHAARAHAAMCPWGFADGRKGLCGPRSGACLGAGAQAVSAGRGYPAALLRAVGPVAVSYRAGRNTDGAGVG